MIRLAMKRRIELDFLHGRIKGEGLERTFFPGSKRQLEEFWKLSDLRDLEKVDRLVLPDRAADYVVVTTNKTIADGRERSAVFGSNSGEVTISRQHTGRESFKNFIGSGPVSEVTILLQDENPLEYSWNRLFGKPEPIFYHCHPGLTKGDLSSAGVTFKGGQRIEVSPESFIEFINLQSGIFSSDDLATFFESNRYINSALLGTPERVLYIVPTELYLQMGFARLNRLHAEYEKAMDPVLAAAMVMLFDIPLERMASLSPRRSVDKKEVLGSAAKILSESSSLTGLRHARDKVLRDVCRKAGYVCFASSSLDDPVLKKLV